MRAAWDERYLARLLALFWKCDCSCRIRAVATGYCRAASGYTHFRLSVP